MTGTIMARKTPGRSRRPEAGRVARDQDLRVIESNGLARRHVLGELGRPQIDLERLGAGVAADGVVRRAKQLLQDVGAKVFGVVLNNVNLREHDYYYYRSYYLSSRPNRGR